MSSEKELVEWVYLQVKATPKPQADLCAAFDHAFSQPPEDLVTFLSGSKYFRKTGVGDESKWMISANREDDLRDYLEN